MSYPTIVNLVSAVTAILYQHADWPRQGEAADPITIYGGELPAGWSPGKSVLVLGDGGPDVGFVSVDERVTFWCYGASEYEAAQAADHLEQTLLQDHSFTATLAGETVRLWNARKMSGPYYMPDRPDGKTVWPRYVVSYQVDRDRHAIAS